MCICCKIVLDIECYKKTCDECIYYIGYNLVCPNCGKSYSRTNRERHYRSYNCRITMYYEL